MSDVNLDGAASWLSTQLARRGHGPLRASPDADPVDYQLRMFGQKEHASAAVVKLGVRLCDPSGLLDGVWTEHVGVGPNADDGVRAALEAWMDVVVPALARRCTAGDGPDLELKQAVAAPGGGPPTPEHRRWAVWLGPPQLRAPEAALPALVAQVEAQGLFARLVSEGKLPHFPAEEHCHWLELTVAQHGTRRIDACRIDGRPWGPAGAALETFRFSDHAAPMHVHAFALLTQPLA